MASHPPVPVEFLLSADFSPAPAPRPSPPDHHGGLDTTGLLIVLFTVAVPFLFLACGCGYCCYDKEGAKRLQDKPKQLLSRVRGGRGEKSVATTYARHPPEPGNWLSRLMGRFQPSQDATMSKSTLDIGQPAIVITVFEDAEGRRQIVTTRTNSDPGAPIPSAEPILPTTNKTEPSFYPVQSSAARLHRLVSNSISSMGPSRSQPAASASKHTAVEQVYASWPGLPKSAQAGPRVLPTNSSASTGSGAAGPSGSAGVVDRPAAAAGAAAAAASPQPRSPVSSGDSAAMSRSQERSQGSRGSARASSAGRGRPPAAGRPGSDEDRSPVSKGSSARPAGTVAKALFPPRSTDPGSPVPRGSNPAAHGPTRSRSSRHGPSMPSVSASQPLDLQALEEAGLRREGRSSTHHLPESSDHTSRRQGSDDVSRSATLPSRRRWVISTDDTDSEGECSSSLTRPGRTAGTAQTSTKFSQRGSSRTSSTSVATSLDPSMLSQLAVRPTDLVSAWLDTHVSESKSERLYSYESDRSERRGGSYRTQRADGAPRSSQVIADSLHSHHSSRGSYREREPAGRSASSRHGAMDERAGRSEMRSSQEVRRSHEVRRSQEARDIRDQDRATRREGGVRAYPVSRLLPVEDAAEPEEEAQHTQHTQHTQRTQRTQLRMSAEPSPQEITRGDVRKEEQAEERAVICTWPLPASPSFLASSGRQPQSPGPAAAAQLTEQAIGSMCQAVEAVIVGRVPPTPQAAATHSDTAAPAATTLPTTTTAAVPAATPAATPATSPPPTPTAAATTAAMLNPGELTHAKSALSSLGNGAAQPPAAQPPAAQPPAAQPPAAQPPPARTVASFAQAKEASKGPKDACVLAEARPAPGAGSNGASPATTADQRPPLGSAAIHNTLTVTLNSQPPSPAAFHHGDLGSSPRVALSPNWSKVSPARSSPSRASVDSSRESTPAAGAPAAKGETWVLRKARHPQRSSRQSMSPARSSRKSLEPGSGSGQASPAGKPLSHPAAVAGEDSLLSTHSSSNDENSPPEALGPMVAA